MFKTTLHRSVCRVRRADDATAAVKMNSTYARSVTARTCVPPPTVADPEDRAGGRSGSGMPSIPVPIQGVKMSPKTF